MHVKAVAGAGAAKAGHLSAGVREPGLRAMTAALTAGVSASGVKPVHGKPSPVPLRGRPRRRQAVAPVAIGQRSVMPNAMQASDAFEARQLLGLPAVFSGEFPEIDQR